MTYKERMLEKAKKQESLEKAPATIKHLNNQIMAHSLNRILYKKFLQEKVERNKEILDKLKKI